MKLKMFAIFDVKAAVYIQPMFFRRTEEAIRSFGIACNSPESDFYKYAEDYCLCEMGAFDDENGEIVSLRNPVHLMLATLASTKHKDHYASISLKDVPTS